VRRSDVEGLLSLRDCIDALEEVFRLQGQGKIPRSEILGVKTLNGGLHVKAGLLPRGQGYIIAKLNTNFPVNRTRSRWPQFKVSLQSAMRRTVVSSPSSIPSISQSSARPPPLRLSRQNISRERIHPLRPFAAAESKAGRNCAHFIPFFR
jgi:hypothetical protein